MRTDNRTCIPMTGYGKLASFFDYAHTHVVEGGLEVEIYCVKPGSES